MVGSIVVVGTLTCCALLHSLCDLKEAQMNIQHSLIQELMLYVFKLGDNVIEATKNICHTKEEGAVDYSNKKIRPKLVDSPSHRSKSSK